MQERNLDLPFIVVSGAIGEDTAVAVMKAGAHDYVMKDKLARLVPAIERELREAQVRRSRRIAERLLRESQHRYEELINSIDGVVWEAEPGSFRLSFVTEKAVSFLGFPTYQWLAEPSFWINHIDPADREWVVAFHRIAVQTQTSYQVEYRRLRADGSSLWVRDIVSVVRDSQGHIALRGIMVDIDVQKQREHELAAIAALGEALRGAATRLETLHIVLSTIMEILRADAALFCRCETPLDCQIELGRGDWQRYMTLDYLVHTATMESILRSTRPHIFEGSEPHVITVAIPLHAQGRPLGVLWICRAGDAQSGPTASKELTDGESRLLSSLTNLAAGAIHRATLYEQTQVLAHQLQQIMNTAPQGFLLLDEAQQIVLANPSAQASLRLLAGACVGERLNRLGERPIESILAEHDRHHDFEIVVNSPQEQIFEIAVRPVTTEFAHKGWLLVLHDVTEIRHAQQHAQQQSRLAAIGQLAAGIAHDFNNILGVITLYTGLVQRSSSLTAKDRDRLDLITGQIGHATNLIHQILDFSRKSIMERAPTDLVVFVHDLARLLEHTLPDTILLRFHHTAPEFIVNADPSRLQQALINLVVNARDAMPRGGVISFAMDSVLLAADATPLFAEMTPGLWVHLSITDTGSGIEPHVLPHLFTPFFTTKDPGHGTGLGLAQVYGIITDD
jgi:PAS domain S-box-containing protein